MIQRRRAGCLTFALATVLTTLAPDVPADAGQRAAQDNKKPSVALRATPPVGFAPLKVRIAAELRGGADDYEDFYCATVEWDWADGTTSGTSEDCNPYEPGKSEIKRRYIRSHTFEIAGTFQVEFYLKQKDKRVLSGRTTVNVRPGLRDGIGN